MAPSLIYAEIHAQKYKQATNVKLDVVTETGLVVAEELLRKVSDHKRNGIGDWTGDTEFRD